MAESPLRDAERMMRDGRAGNRHLSERKDLVTQTANIAARGKTRPPITDPLSKEYWTRERLAWLEEAVNDNNDLYADYSAGGERVDSYQGSTSDLVRRLKGLPEWAGLSERQAHRAVVIGLARLRRDGEDAWDLLPSNELNGLSAEDDFVAGWKQLRVGSNPDALRNAVEKAKASPISWSEELIERLYPVSGKFKVFCDVCIYLQSTVGGDGYILLPQHQLAELLGLKQSGISSFCQRAESGGLLEKLDGSYSRTQRKAIRWRCTRTWCREEAKTCS